MHFTPDYIHFFANIHMISLKQTQTQIFRHYDMLETACSIVKIDTQLLSTSFSHN